MITVIADDLTGAAEIAGICLRYGIDVAFGIDTIPEKTAQVTVIATDSRSLNEDEAYKKHLQLTKDVLKENSNQIIFKKCDSVLRGHVLTELSALMKVSKKTTVLLQPSNPEGKRCIKNSKYYIEEELIEKTSFASDPDFPATNSSVKEMFSNRSHLESKVYTGNISKIEDEGYFIPDCNSENDLYKSLDLYEESMLIAGSAAFFEQFLIKMNMTSIKKETEIFSFIDNYLLVSGSAHKTSIAYAEKLQKESCPIYTFPKSLLNGNIDETILTQWTKEISKNYSKAKKATIRISNNNIQFKNSSTLLKNRLSFVVKELIENSKISDIFIEGGATAYDVLKKLSWCSFTPKSELAIGVVRMQLNNDKTKHITIKPGSYLWPDGLLN